MKPAPSKTTWDPGQVETFDGRSDWARAGGQQQSIERLRLSTLEHQSAVGWKNPFDPVVFNIDAQVIVITLGFPEVSSRFVNHAGEHIRDRHP
jgi:hypothetical protein